jgi:hypothetical protein
VPAAAVIPAPLAYIKVVAVKKLVVEFWTGSCGTRPLKVCLVVFGPLQAGRGLTRNPLFRHSNPSAKRAGVSCVGAIRPLQQHVYLEKIRVLRAGSWGVKAPLCLNNVAWNNRIRPRFYSVGLIEQQTS